MSQSTGADSDKSAYANEGDTSNAGSDTANLDAKINKAMSNHMGRLEKRLAQMFNENLSKSVESYLEKMVQTEAPANTAAPSPEEAQGKLTLKALQEQIANLTKGIEARDKAIQEERQKSSQVRMRSEVQAHFARHLGADNKLLPSQVKFYLDQFTDKDGQIVRKVVDEYGNESYAPVKEAIDQLFQDELKHLVQAPSRAPNLPPNGLRTNNTLTGNPFAPQRPSIGNVSNINQLDMEMLQMVADTGRPELAQALLAQAQAQANNSNK